LVYAIVHLTITNPDSFARYREHAMAALEKHGAKVTEAAKERTVLEGSPPDPTVMVLLSFEDKDSALAWINDPELAEVHALRRGSGQSDIVLLG